MGLSLFPSILPLEAINFLDVCVRLLCIAACSPSQGLCEAAPLNVISVCSPEDEQCR